MVVPGKTQTTRISFSSSFFGSGSLLEGGRERGSRKKKTQARSCGDREANNETSLKKKGREIYLSIIREKEREKKRKREGKRRKTTKQNKTKEKRRLEEGKEN